VHILKALLLYTHFFLYDILFTEIMITIITLGIILCLIIIIRIVKQPLRHKRIQPSELPYYLEILRNRGYSGGFIIIQNMKSKQFIQFMKVITPENRIEIHSSFFPVKWLQQFMEKIKGYLSDNNIPFKSFFSNEGLEGIELNLGDNVKLCSKITIDINTLVFGNSNDQLLFTLWFENVSVRDEIITTINS